MGIFLKDSAARLDYAVDWSSSYREGATIVTSDWHVEPVEAAGLAVAATLLAPTRTGATMSGGVPGHIYRVANRITLSDGRGDERALTLRIEAR